MLAASDKLKRAWLGLGSNIDADHNLRAAVEELRQKYQELVISPVYESESVGFAGDNFLNLVVGILTSDSLDQLFTDLKSIELNHDRTRTAEKFSSRTLDIDVLTYGDLDLTEQGIDIPRHEILTYAFVLKPLADVAPDELHPHIGLTYSRLWKGFDQQSQRLKPYPIDWDG